MIYLNEVLILVLYQLICSIIIICCCCDSEDKNKLTDKVDKNKLTDIVEENKLTTESEGDRKLDNHHCHNCPSSPYYNPILSHYNKIKYFDKYMLQIIKNRTAKRRKSG